MRSLAEVTACVAANPYRGRIARSLMFDCCASCTLLTCDPRASGCRVRALLAERQRNLYHRQPEVMRERARTYYRQRAATILAQRKAIRDAEPDRSRAQRRAEYLASNEREREQARARYERTRDPTKPRRSSAYNGLPLKRPQHSKRGIQWTPMCR